MPDLNINEDNIQDNTIYQAPPISSDQEEASSSIAAPSDQDEIDESQDVVLAFLPQMETPVLEKTEEQRQLFALDGISSSDRFLLDMQAQQHKQIMAFLDAWKVSIERDAIAAKQRAESVEHMIQSAAYQTKVEESDKLRLGLQIGITNYLQAAAVQEDRAARAIDQPGGVQPVGSDGAAAALQATELAATLVIGASFLGEALTVENFAHSTAIEATAFEKMVEAVALPQYQQEINLLGGLMFMRAIYQATADTLGVEGGKKEKDLAFAQEFAKSVTKLLGSGELRFLVEGMVSARSGALNPAEKAQEVNKMLTTLRVLLAASALAMVYKMETGKITGQEFFGMVNGQIELPEGDVRLQLIALINGYLDELGKTAPNLKKRVERGLQNFMESDPSADTLEKPMAVVANVFQEVKNHEHAV